jgi:dTDP-4-dehydrorhamnose reductase
MKKIKVLILGGGGMLGHKLYQIFDKRFETFVTLRSGFKRYERFNLFDVRRTIEGVDVTDFDSLSRVFASVKPDVVVNAVGVIKQLKEAKDPIASLTINSLLPHRLALFCQAMNARLISMSTDCVFDGRKGNYTEEDTANAEDLYGRTKFLGEVTGENCLTLRTSIIGRELETSHSLVEWFLSNRGGKVRGFTKAIYTGFPTIVMANIIADVIEKHSELSGLYQVASEPINKHDLLLLLKDAYKVDIEIEPFDDFVLDRSLNGNKFNEATGFKPQIWTELVEEMVQDKTPYNDWR